MNVVWMVWWYKNHLVSPTIVPHIQDKTSVITIMHLENQKLAPRRA